MGILDLIQEYARKLDITVPRTKRTEDSSTTKEGEIKKQVFKNADKEALNLAASPLMTALGLAAPVAASLLTYSPDAEGASFVPAKNLTGLRGDIAKSAQEEIEYSAKRGYPIFNRSLFNHFKIPLFVSPSSGQLMTVNPALDKLATMHKAVAEPTLAKDILDPEILQFLPKLENTVIRPAKDLEFLQMWSSGTQGKFNASKDITAALGKPHPDLITLQSPRIRNDVLAHELQHGVQSNYTGNLPKVKGKDFASNPEDAFRAYMKDWGEQEAFAADAAVRQFQREGMVDLPQFASAPKINIQGTNKADPSLDSLSKLILEALEAGAKEFPFAR